MFTTPAFLFFLCALAEFPFPSSAAGPDFPDFPPAKDYPALSTVDDLQHAISTSQNLFARNVGHENDVGNLAAFSDFCLAATFVPGRSFPPQQTTDDGPWKSTDKGSLIPIWQLPFIAGMGRSSRNAAFVLYQGDEIAKEGSLRHSLGGFGHSCDLGYGYRRAASSHWGLDARSLARELTVKQEETWREFQDVPAMDVGGGPSSAVDGGGPSSDANGPLAKRSDALDEYKEAVSSGKIKNPSQRLYQVWVQRMNKLTNAVPDSLAYQPAHFVSNQAWYFFPLHTGFPPPRDT